MVTTQNNVVSNTPKDAKEVSPAYFCALREIVGAEGIPDTITAMTRPLIITSGKPNPFLHYWYEQNILMVNKCLEGMTIRKQNR
jgi:hypothetical protein